MSLYQEFVDFCASQPKNKAINHSTWDECAIGEFAKFKKESSAKNLTRFASEVTGDNMSVFNKIDGRNAPTNYGEFTQFLIDHQQK